MSADNDLDYWARTENPDKKELKRELRRVADAAGAIEIELHQLCAREEALLMGSRPRHPEELAKVRRERAATRAKSKQARDEVQVMHLVIAGELSGAVALMKQRDESRRERDEAIEARDQYLRERDQARLAEERARESLDELDEAIYDCLPSDDGDAPLDCVERAADKLRALAQERDEARAEVNAIQKENLELREKLEWQAACTKALMESQERLAAELKEAKECEARADVERLRGVLHVMSLDEYESTTSASDKVHAHARRAREALAATAASDGQSDKAHIASLEDLFLKACIRADKHKKEAADAFHRGAEAMREVAIQACLRVSISESYYAPNVGDECADAVRALPIPEDK